MKKLLFILMLVAVVCASAAPSQAADKSDEANDKVLIILAKGFNRTEFFRSWLPLRALGYEVDVASMEKGPVLSRLDGQPDKQGRDAVANLSLKDVKVNDYVGLIIPGGYSPGFLEKEPKALEICKQFVKQDKPIAGVCHGPRLLMRAGLLEGKTFTCLYSVANELADDWTGERRGTYVDEEVVIDGKFITSRYPNDMTPFIQAVAKAFEKEGGIKVPDKAANVVVLRPEDLNPHRSWAINDAPSVWGVKVWAATNKEQLAKIAEKLSEQGDPQDVHGIVTLPDSNVIELRETDAWKTIVGKMVTGASICPAKGDTYDKWIRTIAKCGFDAAKDASTEASAQPTAVIAVKKGFDGKVVAAMKAFLEYKGKHVAIVGHERGWVKGLNGMPVKVDLTYDEDFSGFQKLDQPVVVAPGGHWPVKADARQADQPEWIDKQDKRDQARINWLLDQYKSGATLVTFGMDSLYVGKNEMFKGKTFAGSDQTVWAFGKQGGRYSNEPAKLSAERLISATGPSVLSEAMKLLEKQLKTTAGDSIEAAEVSD
ncbi:MAG: DJ-1/PfpI family protein [Phycisphaerae bacterium]